MLPAASQPLSPPPDQIAPLLADLRRGDLSFNAIAARHTITPDTLALWINTPSIREQLEATDTVSTWRTRLIAAESLTRATVALNILLQRYISAHQHPTNPHELAPTPEQPAESSSTSDIRHPPSNIPTHESARRAAATLLRIANLRPTPSPESLSRKREVLPALQDASPNTAPTSTAARAQEQTTEQLIQAGLQAAAQLREAHPQREQGPREDEALQVSAPPTLTPEPTTRSQTPLEYFANNPPPEDFNHQAFQSDLEAFLTQLESNPEAPEHQNPDAALQAILQKHLPIHSQAP